MQKKLVVYTCVTGNYDSLRGIDCYEPEIDYICFVDEGFSQVVPEPWKLIYLPSSTYSNKLLARYCKLNAHKLLPQYEKSLWIDGNIVIDKPIKHLILDTLAKSDIASYDHWWRSNTYQELYACARHGFDFAWVLHKQFRRYSHEEIENLGMFENNVLFRNHTKKNVVEFEKIWWDEFINGGKRDQYSFVYSSHKAKCKILSLGIHDPRISKVYFNYLPHKSNFRGFKQIFRQLVNYTYIFASRWKVVEPELSDKKI